MDSPSINFDWNALWTALGATGTGATALVAWSQIGALKRKQQGWRTLQACEKYKKDQVINEALKSLRVARDSGQLQNNPRFYRQDATTVLNYLEGIAIAAAQGFYNEEIVRDQLEDMIKFHAEEFLEPVMMKRMEIEATAYDKLKSLAKKWDKHPRRFEY